uniref:Pecanex-like protein n=1 Tax=Hymenolepis diminuta TaxID=6216 RepID=A0A0R3SJF8_HYMDI
LAASQSPPPLPSASSLSSISAINSDQRRRRISSGGGSSLGGGLSQQQVVSTTSRLSPDMAEAAANAEALLRRFILSPLYRAHWQSSSEVFYFRTISLPFLRNQGISGNEAVGDKMHSSASFIVNENTSVFSPTSSFENLLLLNYHCILGKVPGDSLLESINSCESTVFDAVTLRVAQKRAYLSPLKSATNTILSNQSSKNVNSSSPNSSIEHLAKAFCFDNIFSEDGCDYSSEDSKGLASSFSFVDKTSASSVLSAMSLKCGCLHVLSIARDVNYTEDVHVVYLTVQAISRTVTIGFLRNRSTTSGSPLLPGRLPIPALIWPPLILTGLIRPVPLIMPTSQPPPFNPPPSRSQSNNDREKAQEYPTLPAVEVYGPLPSILISDFIDICIPSVDYSVIPYLGLL